MALIVEQLPLIQDTHVMYTAAVNLYCAVPMSCHYLVVITLQTQDPTVSLHRSQGVVAPPPVCLQGLQKGMLMALDKFTV